MKYILPLFILFISTSIFAQDSYTASNGVTYTEGDTIKLGLGSGLNGQFVHLKIGGWAVFAGAESTVGTGYSNTGVVLKKIKHKKIKGVKKPVFTVGAGDITNYRLDIESAIQTCEVIPCNSSKKVVKVEKTGKYDKLAKIKKLLDQGILTQEEYEIEKDKILNQ